MSFAGLNPVANTLFFKPCLTSLHFALVRTGSQKEGYKIPCESSPLAGNKIRLRQLGKTVFQWRVSRLDLYNAAGVALSSKATWLAAASSEAQTELGPILELGGGRQSG